MRLVPSDVALAVASERLWEDFISISVSAQGPVRSGDRYASIRSAARRAARAFQYDVWNIGVVQQTAEDIVHHGIVAAPSWLPPLPPGQYLADPAYRADADGSCRIFAECLDHYGTGLGEIWCADLEPGESLARARFRPLLRFPHHASYPFPISDGTGRRLLTAETCQADVALLWEDRDRPELLGPMISGYAVVDPTLWQQDGHWFLFCCLEDRNPEEGLFLFEAAAEEETTDLQPPKP